MIEGAKVAVFARNAKVRQNPVAKAPVPMLAVAGEERIWAVPLFV
ncbi:hypothetical protein ACCD06_20935 [Azospirillum sp. CT11-132]